MSRNSSALYDSLPSRWQSEEHAGHKIQVCEYYTKRATSAVIVFVDKIVLSFADLHNLFLVSVLTKLGTMQCAVSVWAPRV
jgi:hypothetical protein